MLPALTSPCSSTASGISPEWHPELRFWTLSDSFHTKTTCYNIAQKCCPELPHHNTEMRTTIQFPDDSAFLCCHTFYAWSSTCIIFTFYIITYYYIPFTTTVIIFIIHK